MIARDLFIALGTGTEPLTTTTIFLIKRKVLLGKNIQDSHVDLITEKGSIE